MPKKKEKKGTSIYAISGNCLGIKCYRGFATLSILSQMSMADEFHQQNNPFGTQRDLNRKHAREAYEYAKDCKGKKHTIWPEIILNIVDRKVVKIINRSAVKGPKEHESFLVKIQIDLEKISELKKKGEIAISRVDGNHRLFFAGGEHRGFSPLDDIYSPFCIMVNIGDENEKIIFRTINNEQKKLNVSHLQRLEIQTAPRPELWEKNKALCIVEMLYEDTESAFYQKIHKGGKKPKGETYIIKQKSLYDGIDQILKNYTLHSNLDNQQTTLRLIIINYFKAIQELWPKEWENSQEFKLMTNTGMQALGIVGGKLMAMLHHTSSWRKDDFKDKLMPLKREMPSFWNSKEPSMDGKSGRPGAQKIAEDIMEIIYSNPNRNYQL